MAASVAHGRSGSPEVGIRLLFVNLAQVIARSIVMAFLAYNAAKHGHLQAVLSLTRCNDEVGLTSLLQNLVDAALDASVSLNRAS